jgi:hypothetical protein
MPTPVGDEMQHGTLIVLGVPPADARTPRG